MKATPTGEAITAARDAYAKALRERPFAPLVAIRAAVRAAFEAQPEITQAQAPPDGTWVHGGRYKEGDVVWHAGLRWYAEQDIQLSLFSPSDPVSAWRVFRDVPEAIQEGFGVVDGLVISDFELARRHATAVADAALRDAFITAMREGVAFLKVLNDGKLELLDNADVLLAAPVAPASAGSDHAQADASKVDAWREGARYDGDDIVTHKGNFWRRRGSTRSAYFAPDASESAGIWARIPLWEAGIKLTAGDWVFYQGAIWEHTATICTGPRGCHTAPRGDPNYNWTKITLV